MKSKLWFKAKRYGYGWYPCSWEGWLVLAIAVVLLVCVSSFLEPLAVKLPVFLAIAVLLIAISYAKGEPARWRWG